MKTKCWRMTFLLLLVTALTVGAASVFVGAASVVAQTENTDLEIVEGPGEGVSDSDTTGTTADEGPFVDESILPSLFEVRAYFADDRTEVALNRTIDYIVEVTWEGGAIQNENIEVLKPGLEGLAVLGQQFETLPEGPGRLLAVFTLQPEEIGVATVHATKVRGKAPGTSDGVEAETEPLSIEVTEARMELRTKIGIGALVMVGVAVAGFVAFSFFGGAAPLPGPGHEEDIVTPAERLRAELATFHRKVGLGDYVDLHEKTDKWVKSLLASLTDRSMRQATLAELKERLTDDLINPPVRDQAFSILQRCYQVKYAGSQPDRTEQEELYSDCERLFESAREFLTAKRSPKTEEE